MGSFGPHVLTGATLFCIQEGELKKHLVISGHPEHFLVFDLKNTNISHSTLRANEKCRAPFLRLIHSFIKKILKKSGFEEWGLNKKYYNKSIKTFLNQHNITVYQGSTYKCDLYEDGLKLLVSPTNRIIRQRNFFEEFLESNVGKTTDKELIKSFFVGCSALCVYNHRIIRIDDVDFTKSLDSTFPDKKFKTYREYY